MQYQQIESLGDVIAKAEKKIKSYIEQGKSSNMVILHASYLEKKLKLFQFEEEMPNLNIRVSKKEEIQKQLYLTL